MKGLFTAIALLVGLTGFNFALPAVAEDRLITDVGTLDKDSAEKVFPAKRAYSPYAGRNFPTRPLFGDTHLHTSFSMDAGAFGARLGPADAYRFAKGEEVMASSGQPAKLSRPLDFLVVADHSDNMGFFPQLLAGNPGHACRSDRPSLVRHDPVGPWRRCRDRDHCRLLSGHVPACPSLASRNAGLPIRLAGDDQSGRRGQRSRSLHRLYWIRVDIEYRRQQPSPQCHLPRWVGAGEPGRAFHGRCSHSVATTLATYGNGWRPTRTRLGEASSQSPITAIFPTGECSRSSNPSPGKPIDREYAETRAKWERLYEATQIKGDGETHPYLSPNDEFANFERWDKGNLDLSELKKPEMLEYEYARSALKLGLKLESELGVNPYKFGMIGSTDAHTGLAAVEEDNFFGKTSSSEPSPDRANHPFVKTEKAVIMGWETTASGYAAVWASENTREAIFDAMQRRETYATTGPRMLVRFFGGYDFTPADANTRSPAVIGYTKGVPMGGDLEAAPAGKVPSFLVAALKDPIGANLDRYQVVKGWVDAKGEMQEKVYDVAWSGDRKPGADGKVPSVGSTVDVANATWTNTIGAPELIAVWTDPDFDPTQRAFYYGRVLEIPTPRWTAYDAKYFNVKMAPEVPMQMQERAYTSPIWYSPPK